MRGYFGIGIEGVSKPMNFGSLLRTAHAFGAVFCFIVGAGFDAREGRLADTADTPDHVPLWRFPDLDSLQLPHRCVLVGVELLESADFELSLDEVFDAVCPEFPLLPACGGIPIVTYDSIGKPFNASEFFANSLIPCDIRGST